MSPLDYLRDMVKRGRKPATPPRPPKPPRDMPWTNATRTVGACTHDVIYSGCNCAATNISDQTKAQDFQAGQQQSTI